MGSKAFLSLIKGSVSSLKCLHRRGLVSTKCGCYLVQDQGDVNMVNQAKQISDSIPMKPQCLCRPWQGSRRLEVRMTSDHTNSERGGRVLVVHRKKTATQDPLAEAITVTRAGSQRKGKHRVCHKWRKNSWPGAIKVSGKKLAILYEGSSKSSAEE